METEKVYEYLRLLSAMSTVGIPTDFIEEIAEEMGLEYDEVYDLFQQADDDYQAIN